MYFLCISEKKYFNRIPTLNNSAHKNLMYKMKGFRPHFSAHPRDFNKS